MRLTMYWILMLIMITASGVLFAQTEDFSESKTRILLKDVETIALAKFAGQLKIAKGFPILFNRGGRIIPFVMSDKDYIELERPIDWGVIRLEVETNKKVYQLGEPIGVRQYIRNVTDHPITGAQVQNTCFYIPKLLILKDPRGDYVEQIMAYPGRFGVPDNKDELSSNTKKPIRPFLQDVAPFPSSDSSTIETRSVSLKPDERMLIYQSGYGNDVLNHFFNLTKVGTYELTFCRKIVHEDGTIEVCDTPKPCTVSFEVRGGFYSPEWADDDK